MARYPIGLADLLRAASALEVEGLEGLRAIESALGVERRGARTHRRTDPVPPEETPTGDRDFEASRASDPRDSAETREHDESEDDVSEAPEAPAPDPFRLVELEPRRRRAARLRSRPLDLGPPAKTRIPTEPLVPARWTRSLLVRGLTQSSPGTELDVDALLDCAARGQTPRRIPFRNEQTLRRGVVLLVDRTPSFAPFANDVEELLGPLRVVAGPALLGELAFEGDPQDGVYDLRSGEPQPYEHPLRGSTALVLGDLGALSRRRRGNTDWVALGRRLRRAGVEPAALVPLNPKRLSREILGTWRVVPWGVRRGAAALDPTGELLPKLEEGADLPVGLRILHRGSPHAFELARRLSLAARIDPALVRAMRRRFLPDADPAIEAELASSPILASRGATGLEFEDRARDALREHLGEDKKALEETHAVLREFRRGHGAELTLQLEERWNRDLLEAGTDPSPRIQRDLRRLLSTLLQADEQRERVARWVFTRMTRFPAEVRGLPEARSLHAAASLALGAGVTHDTGSFLDGGLGPIIDSMPTIEVGVALHGGQVVVHEPPLPGDSPIEVPDTVPRTLELREWSPEASEARKARKSGSPALDFVRQRFSKNPNELGPTVETLRWRRDGEARSEGTFQTIALEDIRGHCRGLVAQREAPSGASQTPMLRVERIVVLGRTAKLRADVSGALARGRVLLDRQSHPVLGADRAWRMRAIRVEAPGREPSLRCIWELPYVEGEAAYEQRVWTHPADLVIGVLDGGDDGVASGTMNTWRKCLAESSSGSHSGHHLISVEIRRQGSAAIFPSERAWPESLEPFVEAWQLNTDLSPESLGTVLSDWVDARLSSGTTVSVPGIGLWEHVDKIDNEFDALGPQGVIELAAFSEAVAYGESLEPSSSASSSGPSETSSPTVLEQRPALEALGVIELESLTGFALDSRDLPSWVTQLVQHANEVAEPDGRASKNDLVQIEFSNAPIDSTHVGMRYLAEAVVGLATDRQLLIADGYDARSLPWLQNSNPVGNEAPPRIEDHGIDALERGPVFLTDHPALDELRNWHEEASGQERVAVLFGAPGCGKTALAREFVEEVLRLEGRHAVEVWSLKEDPRLDEFEGWLRRRVPGSVDAEDWGAVCAWVAAETSEIPTLFVIDGQSHDYEGFQGIPPLTPPLDANPVLKFLRAFAGNSGGSHRILVTAIKEPLIIKGGKRSRSVEMLGVTREQAAQFLDRQDLPGGVATRDRLLELAGHHPDCLQAVASWARESKEILEFGPVREIDIEGAMPELLADPLGRVASFMRDDPSMPEVQILAELHALGWSPHPADLQLARRDEKVETAWILDRHRDLAPVLERLERRGLVWKSDDGRLEVEPYQEEIWSSRHESNTEALRSVVSDALFAEIPGVLESPVSMAMYARRRLMESAVRSDAVGSRTEGLLRDIAGRLGSPKGALRGDLVELGTGVPSLHPRSPFWGEAPGLELLREFWATVGVTAAELGRNATAIDWLDGYWEHRGAPGMDEDLVREPMMAHLCARYSAGRFEERAFKLGSFKIPEVERTHEILLACTQITEGRTRDHRARWRIAELERNGQLENSGWLVQLHVAETLLRYESSGSKDSIVRAIAQRIRRHHPGEQGPRYIAEMLDLATRSHRTARNANRLITPLGWANTEGDIHLRLRVEREMARIDWRTGDHQRGLELCDASIAIAAEHEQLYLELDFAVLAARFSLASRDGEAEARFSRVLERCDSQDGVAYPWAEAEAILGLAEVHQESNRARDAARCYAESHDLMEALGHPRIEEARTGMRRLASFLPKTKRGTGRRGKLRPEKKDDPPEASGESSFEA